MKEINPTQFLLFFILLSITVVTFIFFLIRKRKILSDIKDDFKTDEQLIILQNEREQSELEEIFSHLTSNHFKTEEQLIILQNEILELEFSNLEADIEQLELEEIDAYLISYNFKTYEQLIILQNEIEQSELEEIHSYLTSHHFKTEEQLIILQKEIKQFKNEVHFDNLGGTHFNSINKKIERIKDKIKFPEFKDTYQNYIKEPKNINNSTEVKTNLGEYKFVNYTSTINEREISYPILKIPQNNCIVRTHRFGINKRRGYKDESFEKSINTFFSYKYQVSGNVRLNTGKSTRPFEPDIAIICSSNKNIRIDIEIDEPYAGYTRQPTHCKGEDINRDNYFKDRGWIVIRFSEYQVHKQENECLKFIATVINSIDDSFQIPTNLQLTSNINDEILWDIVQAQKWEKSKYRENYLNHTFSNIIEKNESLKRDFNKQEIEEEKLVKSTSFGIPNKGKNISFNKENTHKRDKRIKFYTEPHIYTIDGVPVPSASTIISKFFPEFDSDYWSKRKAPQLGMTATNVAEMWARKGKDARDKGTLLHEQIENYYLGEKYSEIEEFNLFNLFLEEHSHLKAYRSEWRIFDDKINIAGTIDLLVKNSENSFDIYDWKRSKKVIDTFNGSPITSNHWQRRGVGQLNHIDDTSYNRYAIQQSLYRYILENNYGISISEMFLIILYPEYDNYYKLSVPYLKNEIEYILNTI